jgi:hypothetical protein
MTAVQIEGLKKICSQFNTMNKNIILISKKQKQIKFLYFLALKEKKDGFFNQNNLDRKKTQFWIDLFCS